MSGARETARAPLPAAGWDRSATLILSAGALLAAGAVAVVANSDQGADRVPLAVTFGLMVAVPIAVGVYAWRRQPESRFGMLLVLAGVGWSLISLAMTHSELPYSVGRLTAILVEASLVYLILSFPSGHLYGRAERVLMWATVAVVGLLFLPSALLVDHFPEPSPWGSCVTPCPHNALMVVGSEPGFVSSVVVPLRELLSALILLSAGGLLALRIRRSTRLMRRVLVPVLVAAIVNLVSLSVLLYLRRADPGSSAFDFVRWVFLLSIPGMALGFLAGLFSWRLFAADALERLAVRLRSRDAAANPAVALAETLGDPTLELIYRVSGDSGSWVDASGRAVDLHDHPRERCLTEIREGDRAVAAVIHDPALGEALPLVRAAASTALVALDNQRLAAELRASLRELRASRARVVVAADDERRRIERDLHDGAQQQLVSLRVRLKLAEEQVMGDGVGAILHDLGDEVDAALDEIRALARGIYPALLEDQGLTETLRAAALRTQLPVDVDTDGAEGRYPPEVENAVYFTCLEALQNAIKHAEEATEVSISVWDRGELCFEVRDDGGGFTPSGDSRGAGLRNMHDRVAAVGGELVIESVPGRGTRVAGAIPLRRNGEREGKPVALQRSAGRGRFRRPRSRSRS